MARRPIRAANCPGFCGDRLTAAREMPDGPVDVLTGGYLAEMTMLILRKSRRKDVRLLRLGHPDAASNEEAAAHLHITGEDEAKVGRALSNVTQELALGGQVVPRTVGVPTASAPGTASASPDVPVAGNVAVTYPDDSGHVRSRRVLVPEELA
jgi:Acyclic terpene utilisation family protein AtuA